MLLEICANSYQSAVNAQKAGAHRIELCQELSLGGLTPSHGLIKTVVKNLRIPCYVLIRPRSGNFVYSDEEFSIMKQDITICKDLGVHGIVSGILTEDHTIDIPRTRALVNLSSPLPFTFHRAFDELDNPKQALHQLIELGVKRILTSGQESTAEKGISILRNLKHRANGRIIILPGGGINSDNVVVFKAHGFNEIHASASISIDQKAGLFSSTQTISDLQKIKDLLNAI